MSEDRQNQNSEAESNPENNQDESQKLKITKTKSRKRRLIIYEWGFGVLVAVASIVFVVNHTLAVISIPLLFLGLISGAFAFRLSLINNGAKHGMANIAWAVVAIPSLILCGFLFWIETNQSKPIDDFTVVPETLIQATNKTRNFIPSFWCVSLRGTTENGFQFEVCPVYMLWYIKITNNRDTPAVIDSYSIVGTLPNGKLCKIPSIDVLAFHGMKEVNFYFAPPTLQISNLSATIPGLKHAHRLDFPDGFLQSHLNGKSIGPHEHVQGWLMLDIPKEGMPDNLRFLTKTGGITTEQPIKFGDEERFGMDIQLTKPQSEFKILEVADISELPIRYYGDGEEIIGK